MSRRTRGEKSPAHSFSSASDVSFNSSVGSHDGSRLQASDSFRSRSHRSSGSFNEDHPDEVDQANLSFDSNLTWDVNIEDLDATAELVHRDNLSSGTTYRRRSPRLQEHSSVSSAGSPSPRKMTRHSDLPRASIHTSGGRQRPLGIKGARESHERQERRRQQQQPDVNIFDSLPNWCWICVVLAAFIFGFLVVRPLLVWQTDDPTSSSPSDRETILKVFETGFDTLRKDFPSQSSRFWRVLKAATRAVLKLDSPPEPAVLMLAITTDSKDTASCFVKHFADLVSKAYSAKEPLTLNASLIELNNPDAVKLFIDDTLSQHLGGGSHVAVLHQLELIPGRAAMIFHGYCDNDNAPHKDAVLVFTVELDQAPTSEDDVIVEERLSTVWAVDLQVDKYTALLSRMAKSVAFVKPETADGLQNVCP